MKALPLLLLPFLTAPVGAESIGDRSNREAYRDAPPRNWYERLVGRPSSATGLTISKSTTPVRYPRVARNSYQYGYSSSSVCTKQEYREEYIPGTARNPGYINSWYDTVEVPCAVRPKSPPVWQREPSPDGNECSEGAILGGILGGGAGAALSQGDGRWWAIPLGIASGAVIGCDIDGG
tara:strand:+ start:229 stop:765 length:537 start_codon:yes stop_codon:yes gene_type:complete